MAECAVAEVCEKEDLIRRTSCGLQDSPRPCRKSPSTAFCVLEWVAPWLDLVGRGCVGLRSDRCVQPVILRAFTFSDHVADEASTIILVAVGEPEHQNAFLQYEKLVAWASLLRKRNPQWRST